MSQPYNQLKASQKRTLTAWKIALQRVNFEQLPEELREKIEQIERELSKHNYQVINEIIKIVKENTDLFTWFDRFFYDEVKAKQRGYISNFWDSLRQELEQQTDLLSGINYHKDDYFDRIFLRNEQEYQYFQNKLAEIKQQNNINLQSKELISTCFKGIIPRRDLPEVLEQFKLSPNFINRYFN